MESKQLLQKLLAGEHCSKEEMQDCMNSIMDGEFSDSVIAALLALLQKKGVVANELAGAHASLMAHATTVALSTHAVDTCGTGGDHGGTYNISTTASLIACSAGVRVAKHGNRSVTSSCGSADVLEALGFTLELPPEATISLFKKTGFAFLFAPLYHPSMKRVAHIRRELGIRTLFNMLGPLLNPAQVKRQLVGVFSEELSELYADVLLQTGARHALIVHASTEEGVILDEPSLNGTTFVTEIEKGVVRKHTLRPEEFGIAPAPLAALQGGDKEHNARIIQSIADGSASAAQRDAALYSSAMACYVGGKCACLNDGFIVAKEALESGKTQAKLKEIIAYNQALVTEYHVAKS
uniref:Anthranilate phosphoribosyltransferase n=1 Tax=Chlorobium chlorochromatii (strain CaD3) TaxID=340177 RepID=TRPD_CHLCH|nr:RecName: Full=Anthranilate phosphoribosyltransferase [Chlorobium chlorochromatii CaD3]